MHYTEKIFVSLQLKILFQIASTTTLGILITLVIGGILFAIYNQFYFITLIYLMWMFFDNRKCHQGGRRKLYLSSLPIWNILKNYFPIRIIKTSELDPNKNYICGYHPHGVFGLGAIISFAATTKFKKIFPDFKPYLLTLNVHFWVPIIRDMFLLFGVCSASKENITWILNKEGKGNLAVLTIGGEKEALLSRPKSAKLVLKKRKGFVKLAITEGASLLPIFAFGENELYNTSKKPMNCFVSVMHILGRKVLGFQLPFFCGRKILSFTNWSFIPFKHAVDVVIGEPINVVQNSNPSDEEVEYYKKLYIAHIKALFEKHKHNYIEYKNLILEIM